MEVRELFSLEGRVALVTGGSRNIGKWIAQGFIAQGAKVYITSRKADACEVTAAELGPNCIAVPQDWSTIDACQALAKALNRKSPALDILVNNAGIAWGEPFEAFSEK